MHADSDSRALRWTLGAVGLAASLVILYVSANMNYRFGFSLGKTPEDGELYGKASVASDVFKAIAPFFFYAAWRARVWSIASAAAVVWVVTTGYALTGAFGHAALNRLDTAGQRTLAADVYKDLRADKKRYEDQLSWLPAHRAVDTVKADLEGVKGQLLWTQSTECTEPRGKQRAFCEGYHKLNAELGNATKADEYNKKIEVSAGKRSDTTVAAVMTEADPQAGIISRTTGWNLSLVQLLLAIAIVALLETGSGLGPTISIMYMMGLLVRPPKNEGIELTAKDITPDPVAEVVVTDPPLAIEGPKDEPIALQPEPVAQNLPAPLTSIGRQPLPGSEGSLAEIGFPVSGKVSGPKREARPPQEAAQGFYTWLRAFDLVREPLTSEDMKRLYAEYCEADHRETTHESLMREELKTLKRVTRRGKKVTIDGRRHEVKAPPPETASEGKGK